MKFTALEEKNLLISPSPTGMSLLKPGTLGRTGHSRSSKGRMKRMSFENISYVKIFTSRANSRENPRHKVYPKMHPAYEGYDLRNRITN